jgi:hypothetical protein
VIQIEKFAQNLFACTGEFLDPHTSNSMILVSLLIPKLAPGPGIERRRASELGHREKSGISFCTAKGLPG